uniref:Cytohesin 1 n=1 Tax=Sphenodon punctatus TaxID=8508 RepID=A0A8D0GWW1_SPHPU
MVLRMEEDDRVPSDLTPEECQELENIRRRKQELLADIQRLKDEIAEVTNEIENLGSTEERKNMQRNKQVAMGRKKFNMDPKKGIQFLIENDLLKNTRDDIAQFLYKGEGLNKTAIGDYLGERDDFNIQVLHAFVELHEFTDLNLVQALRQFLWSFRLPGEAQKIDRMMEAFAQRYCQCNPGVFQSTDTCYVLSFAIIMLNTSLHNPNVKDKPSVERFIAMNRGINDGGDLPEELLRNLYESIKNEPFKIPEDDGNDLTHTFFNPDREGWLLKLAGGRVKTWKRRWFILTDNCLYYFEYTTDKEPRGIIPLENLNIREVEDSKKPGSNQPGPILRDACRPQEESLLHQATLAAWAGGESGIPRQRSRPLNIGASRIGEGCVPPSPPRCCLRDQLQLSQFLSSLGQAGRTSSPNLPSPLLFFQGGGLCQLLARPPGNRLFGLWDVTPQPCERGKSVPSAARSLIAKGATVFPAGGGRDARASQVHVGGPGEELRGPCTSKRLVWGLVSFGVFVATAL